VTLQCRFLFALIGQFQEVEGGMEARLTGLDYAIVVGYIAFALGDW